MREDVEPIARDAYWTDIPWLLGLLILAALVFFLSSFHTLAGRAVLRSR